MDGCIYCSQKRWLVLLSILFILECYFNVTLRYDVPRNADVRNLYLNTTENTSSNKIKNESLVYYKYLLTNSVEVSMDYENDHNSSYYWFMSMKQRFKNIGEEEAARYPKNTPMCQFNKTSLGPIKVNKNETSLEWIEKQNPDVKLGGYYAPAHCRATHRIAVIVPYRGRRKNLSILLRYLHRLLKKQFIEYRIFVIEQYGTEKFNKGTLYNIAFLETQRFGRWDCLIFQDGDLIPETERISYSCLKEPDHTSPAVDSFGYVLPQRISFSGMTGITSKQYEAVNGYSNLYWNLGAEDDDFYFRMQSRNYTVLRDNVSNARQPALPRPLNENRNERALLQMISKLRFQKEGLQTTKYKLISVTKEKLYTHILADVNPTKMKLDTKSLMQYIVNLYGKSVVYGENEMKLAYPSHL